MPFPGLGGGGGGVEIGDGTLIGQNVVFATCNHDLDPSKQRKHHFAPIKIGRYVWIGANATILHGVTIGDWAVVGAGAVVTRDVPAMRVVAGVPAKVIQVVPGKMGKMGNMIKRKNLEYPIVSSKRFEIGFHILNHWLDLRQQGKKLTSFFCDNLIKNIAIYGMGALGERLYNELKNSEVIVKYAIDRIADQKNRQDLKIYSSEEKTFPEIDAIVVTPVQDYWAIVSFLETKTSAAIVSLEDVVNYCIAGD